MARKKTVELESIEVAGDREDTQILNSAEVEAAEAELLTEKAEEKPRRRRNSRSKKTEDVVLETQSQESPSDSPPGETVWEEEPKPAQRRNSRKTESETTLTDTYAEQNMAEVVKHWAKIQEISTVIAQNFDRISAPLKKTEGDVFETQDLMRPQDAAKPSFVVKFATAVSIVAALLSVLSLSMSQSTRHAVLTQEIAVRQAQSNTIANHEAVPTAPSEVAVVEKPLPLKQSFPAPKKKENFFKVKK